jgi:dUTP pyrophosphatase
MDIIERMRLKIQEIADPSNPYSQEDFDAEFANTDTPQDIFNYKISVGFKNESDNQDPEYATSGSSGFDLRANTQTPIILKAGNRAIIPTGLYFELPDNFELQIRPRSGLAAKNGVTVLNTPGTVDADYRGEVKVILINLSTDDFVINHGDRIAQGVLATVTSKNVINLLKLDNISSNTERGSGGFGSTGIA